MSEPDALAGWATEAVLASRADRVVVRARRYGEPPVVLKATLPGAAAPARATLRREARLLERARGAGVVDLREVLDRRRRTVLVLAFVPAGTLDAPPTPDPAATRRRLEATVRRLHGVGLVHGAIRAEHVALDAEGLPVLLGFGSARRSAMTAADDAALARLLPILGSGG